MLKITVPAAEFWDEIHEEFVYKKEQALQLEHSLKAFRVLSNRSMRHSVRYFLPPQPSSFMILLRICENSQQI